MLGVDQIRYFLKGVLFLLISSLCSVSQVYSRDGTAFDLRPSILPLSREECRLLKIHHTSNDVAFQPGAALDGSPVAPADLPGSPQIDLSDVVSFDLLLRPDGPGDLKLEGSVGVLSVEVATGALILNGKRLDERRAVVWCDDDPQSP